ncbi:MAG TPA: C40 family peptidase [Candidatus Elarobacter sp.]|nr:C40 family peptidase [Candidatus Elarobacter sp.]
MHRSILTGLFVCILSAGLPAMANADTTGEQVAPAVATTPVTSASPATNASEVAAPTDGADLAMWNASPAKAEDEATATVAPARVSRFAHLQKLAGGIAARGAAMASSLTRNAMKFLGVRYSFGGSSAYGFDCSGYTQHVFAMMGVRLPRMADEQYYAGKSFSGSPKAGDLVFFHTYAPGVSHVGISLGGDKFVHASSSHGVMVSSLHDSYWGPRYLGAKRVVE